MILKAVRECGAVITIEENTLCGGFGSTVLEAANDAGLPTQHIKRLGIPDRFVEHGSRQELLADLGLDAVGFIHTARSMTSQQTDQPTSLNQPVGL